MWRILADQANATRKYVYRLQTRSSLTADGEDKEIAGRYIHKKSKNESKNRIELQRSEALSEDERVGFVRGPTRRRFQESGRPSCLPLLQSSCANCHCHTKYDIKLHI